MADPKLTIVGDSAKAEAAVVALEKKVDKLQHQLRMTSRVARKAGQQTKQAFGASAINSIGSYAAQFVSVTAAIGAATAALQHHDKVRSESAQKQRAASAGLGSLAQLATTPDELRALVAEARTVFGQGVGQNVSDAANLVFSMTSAGMEGADRQLFVDLAANKVLSDTSGFALAANALQKAIGQQITGDFSAIASKAFAASAASPASADQLLIAAAGAGGTAARLGITDADLLSATAIAATPAGGASEGGTQISALLAVLEKQGGFEGLSIQESVKKIEAMGLQGAELVEFFGRKEALAGFSNLLQNINQFSDVLDSVNAAQRDNLVAQRIALPSQVPELAAAMSFEEQQARLENARVPLGTTRNFRDAAEAAVTRQIESEYGGTAAFAVSSISYLSRFNPLRSDQGYLEDREVQAYVQKADPKLFEKIAKHLESLDRKTSQRTPTRNEE